MAHLRGRQVQCMVLGVALVIFHPLQGRPEWAARAVKEGCASMVAQMCASAHSITQTMH